MTASANLISTPLSLPCGKILPNRLVKAAMTEWLADPADNLPNEKHCRLYAEWARGGAGTLITGNVLVDRRYLESPYNVAAEAVDLDDPERLALFKQWATAIRKHNAVSIVQLGHAGRQSPRSVTSEPVSPSAVKINLPGGAGGVFKKPRAMTEAEIEDVIERYVVAARLCKEAGFDGVQIHSAHGYLLSSWLSPLVNMRTDKYGGTPEKRRLLLLTIVRRIKQEISGMILAIKLNSSDFQKGGFSEQESLDVIEELKNLNIDFLEISGGTYEVAAMAGVEGEPSSTQVAEPVRKSTRAREAYFVDFARQVTMRFGSQLPLMVTGGWRSGLTMNAALQQSTMQLIGLARPLCIDPDFAQRLLAMHPSEDVAVVDHKIDAWLPVGQELRKTLMLGLISPFHIALMAQIAAGKKPSTNDINLMKLLTVDMVANMIYSPRRSNPLRTVRQWLGFERE
ncbi:hypothetical protein PhCBS80983_g03909 [Powellomyces hirtus]|uniref:NADH:flavin oxidoreductase/NADH oxidase N-terminal domain-containing protein n=1 Tax=Powellomyces hirtus TaxID=109895 RepID=A0A507E1Y6_9FUNG|nr:hypothetical protein PhCBS80983_g03909 [Powellomyces hirtus]